MAVIDYLRHHGLHAEPLPDGRLWVWPDENITDEVELWIKSHRSDLLQELSPANSDRRRHWRVIAGGKAFRMIARGRLMSPEEALEAARARWSDARIEH